MTAPVGNCLLLMKIQVKTFSKAGPTFMLAPRTLCRVESVNDDMFSAQK